VVEYGYNIFTYKFLMEMRDDSMEIGDGINIELYSMQNAQNSVLQTVSTSMLAKTLDVQEMQGEQMTKMMEQSVNPNLGANIDIRV
jgi:hypothetical protein